MQYTMVNEVQKSLKYISLRGNTQSQISLNFIPVVMFPYLIDFSLFNDLITLQ